jgi:hypothetical protein
MTVGGRTLPERLAEGMHIFLPLSRTNKGSRPTNAERSLGQSFTRGPNDRLGTPFANALLIFLNESETT